jgi:hypothetical protein
MKKTGMLAIFFTLLFGAVNVHAAPVSFTLYGEISTANSSNPFNLSAGNTVFVAGVFDDSPIGSGLVFIDFSTPYNNMEITIGNTIYTDAMDTIGGASLYFFDGIFDGLDYEASDGTFDSWGYLGASQPDFTGTDIEGNWIASSFEVTAVPLPAAVWLFGSGLVFLASIFRRRS